MSVAALLLCALLSSASASALDDSVGRTEVRVRSEPYPLRGGGTVTGYALPERLERLGYVRVRERPTAPGQYFFGTEVFWIYRRGHRAAGSTHEATLIGLVLGPDGVVVGARGADDQPIDLTRRGMWLEPEILAESTEGARAPRVLLDFAEIPEAAWRPVLALEDARFFDHVGVDGISIARALLENARAGEITQGGSTITQQLVKNRDLTPARTLDRKASEAVRALAIEAEYGKEEILGAYLNTVYYGHVEGVGVYGIGAAARVYFGKDASALTLPEGALLAAMLQGPNAISPLKNPARAKERRDYALTRMEELGWATREVVSAAKAAPVEVSVHDPEPPIAPWFRDHVVGEVHEGHAARLDKGLGFVAETTLDPWLQAHAEEVVAEGLDGLRRAHPGLARRGLQGALVAIDADTGAVLAYVGGDPGDPDGLDRASALRQPGSTVKPLLLLEAFEDCGVRGPITPATLVSDDAIEINAPGGVWRPENDDGDNHGDVSVRQALVHSYNLPFVRIGRYCGFDPVAARLRAAGLDLPDPAPPSFVLGAVETSPLALAGAYTPFANAGRVATPWSVARIERPGGALIERDKPREARVASSATAWLVRDLLADVVTDGTGRKAAVPGLEVVGKTGSTDADAWFVGQAGGLVVAVWVGLDEGGDLGLYGGSTAAPLFADFVAEAVPARPPYVVAMPPSVVERRVDADSGRLSATPLHEGETEVFRRGAVPRRDPVFGGRSPAVIR